MPKITKQIGMSSILGDVPAPFSTQTAHGATQDFDTLYPQWKANPSPETNTSMLKVIQPIVDTAVGSYGGKVTSPNLKSRARLMALKALSTYDPQRGNVKTHLLSQLQSLRRLSAQEQNIISIPEQVGLDYRRLAESENELRDNLGRDPLDEELADHTGLSVRRIRKVHAFNQPVSEGMTMARNSTSEDAANTDVASSLPGATNNADAWMNFVYDDLSPTDKLVMDMSLGRNGRKPTATQDIARRLNITPGAVSQRAAKIQNMIDQRYKHNF